MTPGWFRRQVDQAAAEVARWPEWQRRLLKEQFTSAPPQWSCIHRHRCHEAQTCAGKPCKERAMTEEEAVAIVDGWPPPERFEIKGQPFIEVEAQSRQVARTLRQALAEARAETVTHYEEGLRLSRRIMQVEAERDALRRKLDVAMKVVKAARTWLGPSNSSTEVLAALAALESDQR